MNKSAANSTNSNNTPIEPLHQQTQPENQGAKKKRKVSRVRLPTPPPDPNLPPQDATRKTSRSDKDSENDGTSSTRKSSRNEKETEFMDYLESLPHHGLLSRSQSIFAPAIAAEDAFDHLEKLYKLMEQMLQLREQNARLHRRVRDLEHLRNLQSMHQMMDEDQSGVIQEEVAAFDQDSIYAENILENILKKAKQSRFRQSILRKSQRYYRSTSMAVDKDAVAPEAGSSSSGGFEKRLGEVVNTLSPSSAATASGGCGGDKKVSKWTKVKAAFKWEKASSTISDAKSQDSGLSGMVPVNFEVARYLRVPSTSDDVGNSPGDSGAAEISTPGTISSASSTEDVQRNVRRKNIGYGSDEDQIFSFDYISLSRHDPKPSTSKTQPHRTPWAKMKGIIPSRNSFKKQHRLSAKSDDFRMDYSIGSENEDVFEPEDPPRSPVLIVQSPEEVLRESLTLENVHNIPIEIIGRYQQVLADEDHKDLHVEQSSKWSKVKKAFLSSPNISRIESTSPSPPANTDYYHTENEEKMQDEIQRNYQQLQQKLTVEFQGKLRDWERSKQSIACSSITGNQLGGRDEECKDPAFKKKMEEWEKIKGLPKYQLTSEQNLPPEFRKKLEEWKKIKKSSIKDESNITSTFTKKKIGEWPKWKSVSGKSEPEMSQLSDDFIKKLEEWKQIKASGVDEDLSKQNKGNKTPSPRIDRKDSNSRESKRIREQTEKELQWFEKELSKIDREKQRLERERQKFLEREERLSKLRRTVTGNNTKKEILVQTPSGYYRFEGISRKFTQKLYEWEKAQGIGPESSTFALLSSSNIPQIRTPNKRDDSSNGLVRSKSADSIMNSDVNGGPLLSPQPSSLSLNDVDNLEKEVMLGSINDFIPDILDNIDEPEALIIEVEDIVEETASPLQHFTKKHVPVYQRQDNNLCEGETKIAPTIRRSESTRAQSNYNLIEEIITLLSVIIDSELEMGVPSDDSAILYNHNLKVNQDSQVINANDLLEKILQLQKANSVVVKDITGEENQTNVSEVIDTVNDLTSKSCHMANRLIITMRNKRKNESTADIITENLQPNILEILNILKATILEMRRSLSYICAASDMTVPTRKKRSIKRSSLRKSLSIERKKSLRKSRSREDSDEKQEGPKDCEAIIKYEKNSPKSEYNKQCEQGAVKKRLKYRQKGFNSRTLEESDDDEDEGILQEQRKNKPRRGLRSQNSSDSNKSFSEKILKDLKLDEQIIVVDKSMIDNIILPTEVNLLNIESAERKSSVIPEESPVTVFVKTTRKLFTPLIGEICDIKPRKLLTPPDTPIPTRKKLFRSISIMDDEVTKTDATITHLPPLPASPTPQRKAHNKEISPNIRMMLVRYNQKLNEETINNKSAGSSGSASPVAWRSPVLERRVKAQTEKYQQDIQNLSPLLGGRREVQKSASVGIMSAGSKQFTLHGSSSKLECSKGILKSSSIGVITNQKLPSTAESVQTDLFDSLEVPSSRKSRSVKLQKAKEDFFNAPLVPTTVTRRTPSIRTRNRLSQISVASDTSDSSMYDNSALVKSASAGMINIDPTYYKQFNPEMHCDGYVSLPRPNNKGLLSNITSKFRKVKMRKGKEHAQQQQHIASRMNTVSKLCRQSLIVDINTNISGSVTSSTSICRASQETLQADGGRSSADTSPASSRTGSWIRKPKLFKSNK